MNAEHGLLIQILRDLAAREASWNAEADLTPELSSIYQYLTTQRFRRATEDEIESLVTANPEAGELHAWGGFIYLRPCQTRAWAVPILTVTYRFAEPTSLGLRLGLFLVNAADNSIASVGYRFESPDKPGEHGFFHLQHIIEMGNGTFALPTPPWMPQSKLAVPLDVETDVGLLLCMLVSIYGPRSETIQQIASAQYRGMLSPHLQHIRWGPSVAAGAWATTT